MLQHLIPLLGPTSDIKLKHGTVGLLKHLSQSQSSRTFLGEAGTIEALTGSKIWDRAFDIAEVVQLSAIGIVKHLSTGHVDNALKLFKPLGNVPSGIDQISDLIPRTDSLALRNEGTRVLVNVIKTLWTPSSPPIPDGPSQLRERRDALNKLTTEDTADALGEMIGRNVKYPVLLNEGIIALTLLANNAAGVSHVLTALVSPLGPEQPAVPRPSSRGSTSTSQGGSSASNALEMIVHILRSPSKSFPPELRSNACSLLSSVGRQDADVLSLLDQERTGIAAAVKEATKPAVMALARSNERAPSLPSSASSPTSPTSRGPNIARLSAARTLSVWGL